MGRHNFRNLRVRDASALLMRTDKSAQRPPSWYHVMTDYPPAAALARPLAVQQKERPRKLKKYKKPSKMFMPQQITHKEDRLRQSFFSDHPWELARPRILVENDGRDGDRWDWSLEYQEGRPVDGDSVAKRQLYLMTQPQEGSGEPLSRAAAYDRARKELYERRHEDEMAARIQREEALAVDAHFGKSANEVGMDLESREFERWKGWAHEQVTVIEQARNAAYATSGRGGKDSEATLEDVVTKLGDEENAPEPAAEGVEHGSESER